MRIVALTTCHNRREKTLQSLQDLCRQELPETISLEIVVVDDSSTDGTSLAIGQAFPDVEIVEGNGNLYWAGGMRFGWEKSVRHKVFDYLFVYNDDAHLYSNALEHLVEVSKFVTEQEGPLHVITGAFTDQLGEQVTYGGEVRKRWWHPLRFKKINPTGEPQKVDTLNMNGALITSEALAEVGFLASYFKHNVADYEYGLRLRKSGGTVWLSSNWIGWCEFNPSNGSPRDQKKSAIEQLRQLFTPKGEPVYQRLRYYASHGGVFWPILWILPYVRIITKAIFESFMNLVLAVIPKGRASSS